MTGRGTGGRPRRQRSPRSVYLDNNVTTLTLPVVFEAMRPSFVGRFANAFSIYQRGREARAAVNKTRESLTRLVGCLSSEIVFTSGGADADNLAMLGVANSGDHIITSSVSRGSSQDGTATSPRVPTVRAATPLLNAVLK